MIGVVGSIVVIVLAGVAYYRMKKTRAEDTEEGPFPTSGPDETFQHKPEAPPTNHPHPANSDPAAHVSLSRGTDLRGYLDAPPPETLWPVGEAPSKLDKYQFGKTL